MDSVRWNVKVSPDTDKSLRMFLASQGRGKKGDLSIFIEKAVQKQIFEMSVEKVKSANAKFSEEALAEIVNEAILWARNND